MSIINRPIRKIEGFIHDFDGCMANTVMLNANAWVRTFSNHGVLVSAEKVAPLIGTSAQRIITECFEKDATPETINALTVEKGEIYIPLAREIGKALLFPGVEETVISLNEMGMKQAIGTAGTRAMITSLVSVTGLSGLMQGVVSVDDVNGVGKPNPAIFLEASRRIGKEPANLVVVGDADSDMEAGRRGGFGLNVQHVPDVSHSKISLHAEIIIENYTQLLQLLRNTI